MDVSTFNALFAATCFTLVDLWWNVVQSHHDWFAQVGGNEQPQVRRAAFIVLAAVGCACTVRLPAGHAATAS
ncbi:hypothetical protein ACIF8W_09140 [Streptomyces sp. NPDC085639]|uniref:hypothetical protein n=1 Tax=Streptomyces sp. NPDC085639 TaxID=3365734 RepID=UPI0037CEB762